MSLNDLKVFSDWVQGTATEVTVENVELFNTATRGGLVLVAGRNAGDFSDRTLWAKINGLVKRRNAYGSGAVSEKVLSQLLDTSVKVAAGTPPVRVDPGMMKWILKDPKEAGAVYGRQLALDKIADMVGVGVGAARAALVGTASNYNDGSGADPSLIALNTTAGLMGDKMGQVVCWVANSSVLTKIYGQALTNANQLFVFDTVRVVQDGFGRPLIMSDISALIDPTGGGTGPDVPTYFTIGLVPGAVVVQENDDWTYNQETKNGDENIISTVQAEWSYNVGVKGYAWDKTAGGKSPTTAALTTSTNWDKYATSKKDLAGVILESK